MQKKVISVNPYTDEILGEIDKTSKEELSQIINHLHSKEEELYNTPLPKRQKMVSEFTKGFENNYEEIATTFTKEIGVPIAEILPSTKKIVTRIEYLSKISSEVLEPIKEQFDKETYNITSKEPYGTVGIITTWNYLYVPITMMITAFLSGNCVILKPSEFNSLSLQLVQKILENMEIGKYIKIVYGDSHLGEELTSSTIDALSFVGKTSTGKQIMKNVSNRTLPLSLGLSGKDILIVNHDADIENAAKNTISGGFRNNGQSCASVEVVFVHENVFDQYLELLSEQVENLKVGNPLDPQTEIGPVATRFDYENIVDQITDALNQGAKVVHQKEFNVEHNQIISPLILTDTKKNMKIRTEETFGPVIVVEKFSDINKPINEIKNSNYGLTCSIWGGDSLKDLNLNIIKNGLTCINCIARSDERYSWGGVKESGFGKNLSKHSFDSYTFIKNYRSLA